MTFGEERPTGLKLKRISCGNILDDNDELFERILHPQLF